MAEQTIPDQQLIEPKYRWFTKCPQDHMILVVKGGRLVRIIHEIKGWHVNSDLDFTEGENSWETTSLIDAISREYFGQNFVGLRFFGRGMHRYKFEWTRYKTNLEGEVGHQVSAHDPEYIYVTPFESQYAFPFRKVEVRGERTASVADDKKEPLVPVGFEVTFRVRMLRPRVSLMKNRGDWFGGGVVPFLQAELKSFVGSYTYEQLVRESRGEVSTAFTRYIMGDSPEILSPFRMNLIEHIGVDILHIAITEIVPNKRYEEANLQLVEETKKAEGIRVVAEAQRDAEILRGEGLKRSTAAIAAGKAAGILATSQADELRIRRTSIQVAGGPGSVAADVEKWTQGVHGSGLTTYVEGGGKNTSILVGADGKPISS